MDKYQSHNLLNPTSQNDIAEISKCNEITQKYGLILSQNDANDLAEGRKKALKDTDRVEFSGGIIKKMILAFCDSPYLTQDNYLETMYDLQEAFYYFKNESFDSISDDEIIEHMRTYYDGYAQGSTEYIIGTSLEELCRFAREGGNPYEQDD